MIGLMNCFTDLNDVNKDLKALSSFSKVKELLLKRENNSSVFAF